MIATARFVRDRRSSLPWWLMGSTVMVLSTTALYPSIRDSVSFDNLVKDLPETVRSMFSIDAAIGLTSGAGYLQGRLFGLLFPIVLVIFGIGLGTRAIAGAEEDGTIELTLAQPITRRRLACERYLAVVVLVAGLTGFAGLVTVGSAAGFGALDNVRITGLLAAIVGAGLLAVVHASIAFAVGGATGRHGAALGTATAVAVGGYLLNGLIGIADFLHPFRHLTPWHWYLGRNMLAYGPAPDALVVPVLVSLALFVLGVWRFERRDLR